MVRNVIRRDIVVIGASAGGVEALKQCVSAIPEGFPVSIFVTLHLLQDAPSYLPDLLTKAGALPALHPRDGSAIEPGKIYVAPPNRHLQVEHGHIHLGIGSRENRHRPSINVLFRSAALAYGPRVIGVILTGSLDDGTTGLWEIKRRGGVAVVQDPAEALHEGMPQSALSNVAVDHVVGLHELVPLLVRLTTEAEDLTMGQDGSDQIVSTATRLTCPECRGSLEEAGNGPVREFRCRVGHAYSLAALAGAHSETLERTLWAAAVALEEAADISRQVRLHEPAGPSAAPNGDEFEKRQMARRIRDMISNLDAPQG
jgi:two-component system chemotaxis response regulator CheB